MSSFVATSESSSNELPVDYGSSVSVLAVGDWSRREFATATGSVLEKKSWQSAADIGLAFRILSAQATLPELILLAQSFPGEYRQVDLERLGDLAPLSRVVLVAGTWCEGEMRTGARLEGTLRLYWYEFASWWRGALQSVAAGACPPWSMPLDNPQAGRFLDSTSLVSVSGTVVVDAPDFTVFETLAAAMSGYGLNAVWYRGDNQSDFPVDTFAGVWDGGQLSSVELDRLMKFCRKVKAHQGKVVVLLDFPRVEHIRQTKDAGASAVFAKPYIVDEVVAALG